MRLAEPRGLNSYFQGLGDGIRSVPLRVPSPFDGTPRALEDGVEILIALGILVCAVVLELSRGGRMAAQPVPVPIRSERDRR